MCLETKEQWNIQPSLPQQTFFFFSCFQCNLQQENCLRSQRIGEEELWEQPWLLRDMRGWILPSFKLLEVMQLPKQNWENKLICFLARAFWGWIAVIKELLFVTWSVWEPAPGFSAAYTKSKCVATLLMVLGRCRRGKRDHGKQVPGFWEGVGPRQAAPPPAALASPAASPQPAAVIREHLVFTSQQLTGFTPSSHELTANR